MKLFSDKSLLRVTFDKSLLLLFVPTYKTILVRGKHLSGIHSKFLNVRPLSFYGFPQIPRFRCEL